MSAKVVFAEYSKDKLVSCKIADASLMYDEELSNVAQTPVMKSEYTKNIIPDGDFAPTAGNTVKVMLWDSLNGLKPLANMVELAAE